ncbi:MAG: DPP IV N-terminal domain-containing protein, partial [Alistipes sp.]
MKTLLTLMALGLTLGATNAQSYDAIQRLSGMNENVRGIRSMSDGEHYTVLELGSVAQYSYAKGTEGKSLRPIISTNVHVVDYLFSPDERTILFSEGSKPIYRHSYTTSYYLSTEGFRRPILTQLEAPRDASFSPDGAWIAVSSNNNLWLYDVASEKTQPLTTDGAWNKVINGTTDWVYEEELGFTKAYAFSPDSRKIAYMRFDESRVPVFEMMRYDTTLYNKAFSFKYPKAGGINSTVELWVHDIASGKRTHINTGAETDQYIPYIGWTPDGRFYFYRLNRQQNHFEVVLCNADGTQQVIYDEHSPKYIDRTNAMTVTFLDADRFVVREETSKGYMHLYLYSVSKGLLNPITKGSWDVTELVATTGKKIYYISTETSPLRRNLYS